MTDELFTVPESIDRLAAARRRYEAAEAEYLPALAAEYLDDTGWYHEMPAAIADEYEAAKAELAAAERERLP